MLLLDFIKEHSDWEELLTSSPYHLTILREDDYILFKYNQFDSDFNQAIVREARGCIFNKNTWKCVCRPFDKFGNYGEIYTPNIDWSTARVQEKIDGTLIKLWYDKGWHISTNGTITPEEKFIKLFKQGVSNYISFEELKLIMNPECTYMFELVSPLIPIVVPYSETDVYFIGKRNNETGQEYTPALSVLSDYFKTPKEYSNLRSIDATIKSAEGLPWNKEGYVVVDNKFNRIKVKSLEWFRAHYLLNNNTLSVRKCIDIILAGEQEEFLIYANPEVKKAFTKILTNIHSIESTARFYIADVLQHRDDFKTSKKEIVEYVQGKFPKQYWNVLYRAYDNKPFCFDRKFFLSFFKGDEIIIV